MIGREGEFELALERFTGPNEADWVRGFDALREICDPMLRRYIAGAFKTLDPDEISVVTWTKIWQARATHESKGPGGFVVYLRTVGRNVALDYLRKNPPTTPFEEDAIFWDDADLDADLLELLEGDAWMGYSKDISLADRRRRLVAARLFLIHKKPWEQVCRLVFQRTPTSRERAELEAWVEEEAVIRDLAYHRIRLSNDKLAMLLIGDKVDSKAAFREAECRPTDEKNPGGWLWKEVPMILRRYRHAEPIDRIASLGAMTSAELEDLFDRCRAKFPFINRVKQMQSLLESRASLLGGLGLWYRIAFAGGFRDGLSQKDILERYEGAAAAAGYGLTSASLNVWFGNHRLTDQLKKAYREREKHHG
jgi:DNA-directed RNA polymerase specialized sigma24 family protein